jgi:hypothetical protein
MDTTLLRGPSGHLEITAILTASRAVGAPRVSVGGAEPGA